MRVKFFLIKVITLIKNSEQEFLLAKHSMLESRSKAQVGLERTRKEALMGVGFMLTFQRT